MKTKILHVGLDVHKNTIDVAVATNRSSGTVRSHCKIDSTLVKAYQALRGVSFIVAATVVAEIGEMNRFQNPKQLMAYLGLIPSELTVVK